MNSKQISLFSLSIVIVLAGIVFGVPANTKVWTFTQPDGTTFQAVLCGDEFFSYHQTPEGEIIQQDKTTGEWFYAEPKADGSLQNTAIRVGQGEFAIGELNRERPQWLSAVKRTVDQSVLKMRDVPSPPNRIPTTGNIKGVLLLANFSDTSTQYTQSTFNDLMNMNGCQFLNAMGSVKDYYLEASYGQLSMQTDVFGWFNLPQSKMYYGKNGADGYDENPDLMVMDAITKADPNVNFADYDSDGDGWVDVLGVVHQGQGEEQNGAGSDCIFSHRGSLENPVTVDGVRIKYYYTVPERYYQNLTTIGVFCHEIGHVFRLPDLYDYDGSSMGVGDWSIMASGSWLGPDGNGAKPCHFDPWCKYVLGWIDPEVVYAPQSNISLPGFDTHPTALLIPVDPYQDGEYFLITNRYRRSTQSAATGFDQYLRGSGALILHVDDYMPNNDDETRKKVDVEEADGFASLDMSLAQNGYIAGDAGDLYPNGGSAFDDSTEPNSSDNDGFSTGIAVYDFRGAGTDAMTCDVTPPAQLEGYSILYDLMGNDRNFAIGYDNDGDDYACVRFTADEDGILERVKTNFVYEGTTDYTINIYSGWLGNAPSGLLTTQSGSHTGKGYEEIFLSEPQTFDEGAEFVIEIRYNTHGGYTWPLPIVNDGDCAEKSYIRNISASGYLRLTLSNGNPYDVLIRAGMRSLPTSDSKPSVLVCGAEFLGNDRYLADVRQKLLATGQCLAVSTLNLRTDTPRLEDLQAYDAVLVYGNDSHKDPVAVGNAMADYVDAGGGVVCMMFEVGRNPVNMMQGRWTNEKYHAIARGDAQYGPRATLGTVHIPAHSIMQGVSSFDGGSESYRTSTFNITTGAVLVAEWSDGRPLVVTKTIGSTRRADLGFFPVSSDMDSRFWVSSTDGAQLMANALTWVAEGNP